MSSDLYQWVVIYQDGTFTEEFDALRPDGRGFSEIEEKPIMGIELWGKSLSIRRVSVPKDAQPIFFRRRYIGLDGSGQQRTVHCIGWKRGEAGVYLFVFDDGSTLLSDDLQAV